MNTAHTRPVPTLGSAAESSQDSVPAQRLLRVFDFVLACLVFLAPLAMAGRHPVGRLAFVTLIATAASIWAVRKWRYSETPWRRSGGEWLLLTAILLVWLQVLPLGAYAVGLLSPALGSLLPMWQGGPSSLPLQPWTCISLTPNATRQGLVMLVAYALLFVCVVQRIEHRKDIERILQWLAIAVVAMAVLGLVQLVLGNGRFLWIYEHPSRTTFRAAKGAMENQNHFAHFLALGLGPLVWWLQRTWARPSVRRTAFGQPVAGPPIASLAVLSGLAVVALAGLLSFSRGGISVLFLAGTTSVLLLYQQGRLGKRALMALAGMTVPVVLAMAMCGVDPLMEKLDEMAAARSVEDLSQARVELWAALLRTAGDFWPMGTGVGSHREIYRTYLEQAYDVEFTHAENGYLQVLVETGVVGLLLLLAAIGICLRWCVSVLRHAHSSDAQACGAAITAGIVASLAHSVCDFVWYIPACMALTTILAACACRLAQLELHLPVATWSPRGPMRWAVAFCVLVLGMVMTCELLPSARAARYWDAYLRMSLACNDAPTELEDSESDDVLDPTDPRTIRQMLRYLDRALAKDPRDPRASLRRAALCLRLFEMLQQRADNAMSLAQIREAAVSSHFASSADLNRWLSRAVGPGRHLLDQALVSTLWSLRHCPLQGEGYVYLTELAFLLDPTDASRDPLIAQALQVRPFSPIVLTEAGGDAIMKGDMDQAVVYLSLAFRHGADYQRRIIALVGSRMSAEAFLQAFDPDTDGLRLLFLHYRAQGLQEEMGRAGAELARRLQAEAQIADHDEAVKLWKQCHVIYRQMGLYPQAAQAAQWAVNLSPFDYSARRSLALCLIKTKQYQQAREHLRWCLRQRPHDAEVRNGLQVVLSATGSDRVSRSVDQERQ